MNAFEEKVVSSVVLLVFLVLVSGFASSQQDRCLNADCYDPPADPNEITVSGPSSVDVGDTVTYSASVDGAVPDSIEWNNGDTSTSATYNFQETGSRTVSATANYENDVSVSDSITVDVSNPRNPDSGPTCQDEPCSICDYDWSSCTFVGDGYRRITIPDTEEVTGVTINEEDFFDAVNNGNYASYCDQTGGRCVHPSRCATLNDVIQFGADKSELCISSGSKAVQFTEERTGTSEDCDNGEDDDGDGFVDENDPDCTGGGGNAGSVESVSQERISYNQGKSLTFQCDDGSCPNSFDSISVCGVEIGVSSVSGGEFTTNSFHFPFDAACSLGRNDVDVLDSSGSTVASGSLVADSGKLSGGLLKMTVDSVSGDSVNLKRFELQSGSGQVRTDVTGDGPSASFYDGETGVKLDGSGSLSQIVANPDSGASPNNNVLDASWGGSTTNNCLGDGGVLGSPWARCFLGYSPGSGSHHAYSPRGEIIFGEGYGYGESPKGEVENAKFHICTYGQNKAVYSPGDSFEADYFKCDSGTWKNVHICNDGVDNDGDGATDYETDSSCGGLPEGDSEGNSCSVPSGEEAATMDEISGSPWKKMCVEVEDGTVVRNVTETDIVVNNYNDGNPENDEAVWYDPAPWGENLKKKVETTDDKIGDRTWKHPDDIPEKGFAFTDYGLFNGSGTGNLASQEKFYTPSEGFEPATFRQNRESTIQKYRDSRTEPLGENLSDSHPWMAVNKYQDLSESVQAYNPDTDSIDSVTANGDVDWSQMEDNFEYENYVDAHDKKQTPEKHEKGSTAVWTGGWVGNCKTGYTWTFRDGSWGCFSSSPSITVNFFQTTQQGDEVSGKIYGGFLIEQEAVSTAEGAFNPDRYGEDPIRHIWARCWHGSPSAEISDESNSKEVTASIGNVESSSPLITDGGKIQEGDTVLLAEIPRRPGVDDPTSYSCQFGFRTSNNGLMTEGPVDVTFGERVQKKYRAMNTAYNNMSEGEDENIIEEIRDLIPKPSWE